MQIRSYFWSVFSCIQSEYRNIRTRNNSVFAQFPRSGFSRFSNCTTGTKSRKASHIFYYNNLIPASSLILVLKLSFFILILSTARHDASIRGGSRTAATSKMECFVIIVNGFQRLTIIAKHSIRPRCASENLPKSFHTFCTVKSEQHRRNTKENSGNVPPVKTTTYRSNSVTICAIRDCSNLQNRLSPESALPDFSGHKFLKTIKKIIVDRVDL